MLSCTCLQLFQFLNIFNVSGIHPTLLKWFSSPTWTLEWFSWGRCLIFRIKNFKINCNEWWRYIYVRFASDLASSGDKLFKILVSVSILTFCLQWLIIYPVVGNIISVNCLRININLWSGNLKVENYPLNSIKGKICTQTFINEFENQEENVDMILKPKFILYTTGNEKVQKIPTEYFLNFSGIFIIGIIIWCTAAAQRMAQAHPIKKYRRHLLTMKSHCVLACSFGL